MSGPYAVPVGSISMRSTTTAPIPHAAASVWRIGPMRAWQRTSLPATSIS